MVLLVVHGLVVLIHHIQVVLEHPELVEILVIQVDLVENGG